MKKIYKERHLNGNLKHIIYFNEDGYWHRENGLPSYQRWYENGQLKHNEYCHHGKNHNICNPAYAVYYSNGKIWWKYYGLNNVRMGKLLWLNKIKNI